MIGSDVVERFLRSMAAHDWESMAGCVSERVQRVGPYGDVYEGRPAYVAFISDLLPTLPGYRLDVDRVVYADGGRLATAELSETVHVDGTPLRTPEGLIFDIGDDGLVGRIAVYIQQGVPDVA